MVTGEILRTTAKYYMPNASEPQNIFIHQYTGAGATDTDIVNSMNAWFVNSFGPAWAAIAHTACELNSFDCDVLNVDGTVKRNLGGLGLNIPGTQSQPYNAAATSGYLLAYTDRPKQRGSKYLPGVSETVIDNNHFTASGITALAALLALYLSTVTVGGLPDLDPGVLSKVLTLFIAFNGNGLVDVQPSYQRRRKEGVGI